MESTNIANKKRREDPLRYLRISTILSYSHGEPIYSPGEPANHIYLVISGMVRVGRIVGPGREIVTCVFREDEVFGEAALIEDRRSGSAMALENTKVMVWTSEQIEAVGKEHPKLFYALLQIMVERLGNFENRLQSFTVDDARRRLIRALMEFSKDTEVETSTSPIWVPSLTHELLASYIGTSREVVTQLMNLFRKQGLLNYSRKAILVFRDRMLQHLQEEEAAAGFNLPRMGVAKANSSQQEAPRILAAEAGALD